jgi:hypothetical protein
MPLVVQNLDIQNYRYLVRGYLELSNMHVEREEYVNSREQLDKICNDMISKGYAVFVIPTSMVTEIQMLIKPMTNVL